MRVAIVTESFLPAANGVTTSVLRVLDHLQRHGHEAVVVCPQLPGAPAPAGYAGAAVVPVPAWAFREFGVGVPTAAVQRRVQAALAAFAPDVVHVASPFALGYAGLAAARRLDVPSVAIYQTDVAGFARHHGPPAATALFARAAWRWIRRLHDLADLTLAPSSAALADLRAHGVARTALWGRGVDVERFHPGRRGTAAVTALRRALAARAALVPAGAPPGVVEDVVLVGYVGRLAPEKRVERLAALAPLTGTAPATGLVVVGEGPCRAAVARALDGLPAVLTGRLDGEELADAYGALDVFVHTGTQETFGQTLQEAMASGVPVVAPASGGPLDLVAHGSTGLLYAPDDDAALADAVRLLSGDAPLRRRMGGQAAAGVRGRGWAPVVEELIGRYEQVRHRGRVAA
ncbi:MAG: glycosyltransferase family 1 protein [Kineosporiaceae bacterium]